MSAEPFLPERLTSLHSQRPCSAAGVVLSMRTPRRPFSGKGDDRRRHARRRAAGRPGGPGRPRSSAPPDSSSTGARRSRDRPDSDLRHERRQALQVEGTRARAGSTTSPPGRSNSRVGPGSTRSSRWSSPRSSSSSERPPPKRSWAEASELPEDRGHVPHSDLAETVIATIHPQRDPPLPRPRRNVPPASSPISSS